MLALLPLCGSGRFSTSLFVPAVSSLLSFDYSITFLYIFFFHYTFLSSPSSSFSSLFYHFFIIIITRPWPAFGRQGLVGSSFEYSYTRLASRLRRSARSGIMTLGKDKTPLLLEPSNFTTFRPSWGNDKTNYFNLPTFWPSNLPTFQSSNLQAF